jgi:hypothetical protein
MDERRLAAPRLRYFVRQGKATAEERAAVIGEVDSPARFRELYALAERFRDRATQADLREVADSARSRCGLVDPPEPDEAYLRECEDWARLARQYPMTR